MYSSLKRRKAHNLIVVDTEEACYACIISEEENTELEKALKVSALVLCNALSHK